MISILQDEYTFSNLFMVCIYLFLPIILFFINTSLLNDNVGFLKKDLSYGGISFFFIGIAIIMIGDYFYRRSKVMGLDMFKSLFCTKIYQSNIHFYLFPIMLLLVLFCFPIMNADKLLAAGSIFIVSAVLNAYLMLFYFFNISYILTLLLLPLGIWQVYMGIKYINNPSHG